MSNFSSAGKEKKKGEKEEILENNNNKSWKSRKKMISEKEEERNIGKWKRSSRKVSINSINSIINFRIKKGKKEEILKTGIINLGNLESEKGEGRKW